MVLPLIIEKVLNPYTRYCLTKNLKHKKTHFLIKTFDPGFNFGLNLKMLKFSDLIVNGDCLKEIKKIPDKSFDLVFADPPYNMQIGEKLTRPDASKAVSYTHLTLPTIVGV